jgi:tetratricopeptide (TPR) repeat protein
MRGSAGSGTGMARWSDGPLLGRDGVITELRAIAEAAARGNGGVVLLAGEAGIGKTSVARMFAQTVRDRFQLSWGACAADQSAPPFWPWRPLVTSDAVADLDGLDGPDDAIGAPRFELLTTLCDQLRKDVIVRPRVHIIEDLQWADVSSVLLLLHVAAAMVDAPFLVVATLRTGEPAPVQLTGAIDDLRRRSRVLELSPLVDDDIATLIRTTATEPEEHVVGLVRARTGGNPLFVNELLRAIPLNEPAERRLQMLAERVPARVSDLVQHRLGRLPAPVADLLVTAAVIGAEGTVGTLAAAQGAPAESVLDLLDQARAAHVLDAASPGRWQFRHQLIRDAVYASVTESIRARRHAQILEVLASDATTPQATLAHHALAAQPLFDPDRAVALAARAGEVAFGQHAYEEALHWFTHALAAAPAGTALRWRAELLLLSGEARRHIGDIGAARQAFLDAAALTDEPALLARAALGYADPGADLGIAYRTDDATTAELLDRAISAQPSLDSLTGVQLETRLAAELYFSDEPSRARELAQSALARAQRLDDVRALGAATALTHDAFAVGQVDLDQQLAESAQLAEWARVSQSVSASLTAHRARVLDLLAAGEIAEMDTEILAFRRIAEPLRAPGYLWWPALWAAMRALLEGRHELAESRALSAYQLGEGPFPSLAFINLSFLLFFLRREQGRLAEMEQGTREYTASHADVPALRVALAFLLAELGRVDEARGGLAAFDEAALRRLHDRNWPASWFQLARITSIVGDRDVAARLLEPEHRPSERCVQISLATVCLGATDLATAWLEHTLGNVDVADVHYRAAEDLNRRIGARSWLAQARADHARLLLERGGAGDTARAEELSMLARAAAAEIGLATVSATPRPLIATMTKATVCRPTFRHDGAVWHLHFADRTAQLADARGLRDLRYLLTRPGEAVSVLELSGDAGAASSGGRAVPVLDVRARQEIRARLHDLDAEEAEAEAAGDNERAALAREQRQLLAEAVARDFGLGGRARMMDDPAERARKTVSTRIRRAIAAVGRAHPELGRHLERSVDTGAWCAYRPPEPVDWLT